MPDLVTWRGTEYVRLEEIPNGDPCRGCAFQHTESCPYPLDMDYDEAVDHKERVVDFEIKAICFDEPRIQGKRTDANVLVENTPEKIAEYNVLVMIARMEEPDEEL